MMRRFHRVVIGGLIGLGWLIPTNAWGVILYSSSQRNTFPPGSLLNHGPSGAPQGNGDPRRLLNSGWQWTGLFGNFVGTAISSQYFITAKHAGAEGPNITVNGVAYPVDTAFGWRDDPNADLRIWKIQNAFPTWAPLYNAAPGSETNQPFVVFGRGTQRGTEVRVNGELKGWQEGALDGVLSWGENVVNGTFDAGSGLGQVLFFDFDRDGAANECFLTDRDSGGGVFIQSGGIWKLAGIALARDGPWRFTQGGTPFNASIFDGGGLWVGNNPQFIPDGPIDIPASAYATMISPNLAWINSIIGASVAPEPSVGLLVVGFAPLLCRRRRD